MPFFLADDAEHAERRWMTRNSRRYGRACDQSPIVIKRDPLISYRDNDLERTLRRFLGLSVLRRIRFCAPVLVLMPERVIAPPRPGPKWRPGMRGLCRKYAGYKCNQEGCANKLRHDSSDKEGTGGPANGHSYNT